MPSFGKSSHERLQTCHPDLVKLFEKVVEKYDCSILEGVRSLERQTELFETGRSKTMKSKHLPNVKFGGVSLAVDVVPYPIQWGEKEQKAIIEAVKNRELKTINKHLNEYKNAMARFYNFAGYVKGLADSMGIELRWGGDWNSNNKFDDQNFIDLPHFELRVN